MPNRARVMIALCLGAIVGVLLVRAFFLNPIEELGWRMFWAALGEGRSMDFSVVVQSTTFAKSLAGLVLGAGAGFSIASAFNRRLSAGSQQKITGTESTQGSHGD